MPICAKLANSMRKQYGERAEQVYHAFLRTPRGKAAIERCVEKHGATEAFDWGFRKGGERTNPPPKKPGLIKRQREYEEAVEVGEGARGRLAVKRAKAALERQQRVAAGKPAIGD